MTRNPVAPERRTAAGLLAIAAAVVASCATAPPAPASPAAVPAARPAAAASAARAAPAAAAASAPTATAAAGPASGARPGAGTPAPFDTVTKDAKSAQGFLTLWTREEKTWLEIPAGRLDQPFFFAVSVASGLGQPLFFPGMMLGEQVVVLRRVGNSVQLVARNLHARAPEGTALARAVAESYSDSLLAAAPLAAAPHPERKSLLVDAQALLGGDIPGLLSFIERIFRIPYGHDRGNSSIERTRTGEQGTALTFRNHYAVPKLPAPPVRTPGAPPPNPALLPNPPRAVPDARSFFVSLAYTLAPLPAVPMKARRADQRVGFFTDAYRDFGNEFDGDHRVHVVQRWRLEKKDPAATLSEPKEPIRVVLDRNIPEKWRATVREGVLEWNKAFERAGFRDALVAEQQPDDADWSAFEGTRVLAVRWFAMEGPGATAIGRRQSDPRTGEILRAAALIPENWVRFERTYVGDTDPVLNPAAAAADEDMHLALAGFAPPLATCTYAHDALEQAAFGLELLQLRGDLQPASAGATRFVADSLKAVVVHEVGHALGLRHNFKASTGVTHAQLRDAAFTASRGISNSVMDYNPPNVPLQGEAATNYHMPSLGAYDFWAIEYGYREFPPDEERQALARLAALGDSDPALAYGPDEDASGIDPKINRFDLGDQPLAFAQRQMRLARELWTRTQARELAADDNFEVYRRNLFRGMARFSGAVPVLTKYVGGAYTSRALAGAGKPLLVPVPAGEQREALDVLLGEVFASESFRFEPRFMTRLGTDTFERFSGHGGSSTDFSLGAAVLALQRNALEALMSDATAAGLADAESRVADPRSLLSYAEVQERLRDVVWSEIGPAPGAQPKVRARRAPEPVADIDTLRRNLQREHLRRLAGGVLRPTASVAADVRAVHRQVAQQLEAQLKAALARPGWSATARAHLADSLATLSEAIKAPLLKQGA